MSSPLKPAFSIYSFFFDSTCWSLSGYYAYQQRKILVNGCTQIHKLADGYRLSTKIQQGYSGETILLRESMVSFENPDQSLTWQEHTNRLGDFTGHASTIDATLLLSLQNKDDEFRSFEVFLKLFESEYELRGVLYHKGSRVLSWRLELIRALC